MNAPPPQRWSHELVLLDQAEKFEARGAATLLHAWVDAARGVELSLGADASGARIAGWYESAPIAPAHAFEQALVSWNAQCPPETAMHVELRVRAAADAPWSPWLYVGGWSGWSSQREPSVASAPSTSDARPQDTLTTSFDGGRVDLDYFTSDRAWREAQFRVRATASDGTSDRSVIVRRVALCFSRRTDEPAPKFELPTQAVRRLDVPFRSQKTERPEIAGRICSPTSVAMALAYRGVEVDTLTAAERIFDSAHDIYGNWTRAIQGAYSFGAPGYLARFSDWNDVARHIAEGTPLVISIAAKEGELDGAPYPKTAGHLLVLCGFDEAGNVHVNDPAASTPEAGQLVYRRDQLENVWMARGGTSYVFLPPDKR